MAKTAIATHEIAFGIERNGSRASSARFDTVSIPVYAIIATGIESAKADHVGATPQWTLAVRTCGEKMRTKPIITSRSCVAKSRTARTTLSFAASEMPTTFTLTRSQVKMIPTITSHGV